MSWEDARLNDHLRDIDVSDARDAEIEERARALLSDDGPDGYAPFSHRIVALAADQIDSEALLRELLPYLVAGDFAEAGSIVMRRLVDVSAKEAMEEARLQIDCLLDEPTAAQEAAYDDRLRGDY
jgi:hypothetical protein